jgi:hypothetical protein
MQHLCLMQLWIQLDRANEEWLHLGESLANVAVWSAWGGRNFAIDCDLHSIDFGRLECPPVN